MRESLQTRLGFSGEFMTRKRDWIYADTRKIAGVKGSNRGALGRRCSNHGRFPGLGPGPDGSAGRSPLCPPAFPTDPGAAMGPPCHGASSLTKSTARGGAERLCSGVLCPCSEKGGHFRVGVGRRSALLLLRLSAVESPLCWV